MSLGGITIRESQWKGGDFVNREAILTGAEDLRRIRDITMNPLRSLTAQSLVRALNNFQYGDLREGAILFEAIAERDDTIPGVKGKREKEVSQMDCAIVIKGEKSAAAEDHKDVLENFWGNVEAVNAYDRDERGGLKRLVKQMMSSVSYRYACHHIVWEPRRSGLRATFQFVPLFLFENRTGALRYREDPYAYDGQLMMRDRWMVTKGDGLMIPCSIGYFFKRDGINNLAIFSDKFSVPGVVGCTSAAKGTPEGDAMREATASYANDWAATLYNVEDPTKLPIHLIQSNGNPSAMPMPAIIERVDRKFAALYRGGDLSTMSSRDGEGQGASLQREESEINKADDAATIEETLAQVSRQVIEYYFGRGVDPLAELKLRDVRKEGSIEKLRAATILADRGAQVSLSQIAAEMEVSLADVGEEVLKSGEPRSQRGREGERNDLRDELGEITLNREGAFRKRGEEERFFEAAREQVTEGALADLAPVAALLEEAGRAESEGERNALLGQAEEVFDRVSSEETAAAYEQVLASAVVNGWGAGKEKVVEAEANAGTSEGARQGWLTRRRRGWTAKASRKAIGKLYDETFSGGEGFVDYRPVPAEEAERILRDTGVDVTGYSHSLDSSAIRHVVKSHGNEEKEAARGQVAVSREDIEQLGEILGRADRIAAGGKTKQGLELIRYEVDEKGGTTIIFEEVRTKRGKLVPKTFYKLKNQKEQKKK